MEKKKLMLLVCALAIGLTVSLVNADIEGGLTGYWPFQEGAGLTTANEAGDNNDGTFINGPIWVDGLADLGKAIDFDGIDDYLTCESLIATSTRQLSLSIWVNRREGGSDAGRGNLISNRVGWTNMLFDLMIRTLNSPIGYVRGCLTINQGVEDTGRYCAFPGEDGVPAVIVPENVWTHIVVTCDGDASEAAAYLNGEYISTGTFTLPPTGISHPTRIGWSTRVDTVPYPPFTLMQEQFCGSMDEVRIYDRILSEADIQQLYEFRTVPGFNSTPYVDAGDYQSILWPADSVQLAATVSDDGRPYQESPPADPCTPIGLTLTWSQLSGTGTVGFSDTTIADPTVTFPAAGYYDLQLRVFDGEKDACDVVGIYVKTDSTLPIAHWDFETGSGTNVVDRTVNDNFGTFAGEPEPNWVAGWIGSGALNVGDGSHVEITVDFAADPNLDAQKYEITVSAWVKVDSWGTVAEWNGIVTKGNGDASGWSLLRNGSNDTLSFSVPGAGRVNGSVNIRDGYWHHVVGVHDGTTMSFYTDGLLNSSVAVSDTLSPNAAEVWIGGNSEIVDNYFDGQIDDVRIYSYGMDLAGVEALAAMGALIPVVDAGENQVIIIQDDYAELSGTVIDDGNPEAATLAWTSDPCNPGTVAFVPSASIEDPCATFSEVGTYVLRLTADDTVAAVYDEVTITVEDPVCQDVIDDGLLITGDISGSEGVPDCYIDLYDVAAFASYWLRCNNPQDSECEFPY